MRIRDWFHFPRADRDGIYGCCHCGSYRAVIEGEKLACDHCKSAKPLVYVLEITPVEGPSKDCGTGGRAQSY